MDTEEDALIEQQTAEQMAGEPQARPEPAEASRERKAYVDEWMNRITAAKTHWKTAFEIIREDMKFAAGIQWEGQTDNKEGRYIANFVLRHVQNKTSSLYARNPTVVAKPRKRMEFKLWDGTPEALQQAMQGAQAGDPMSMELLMEVATAASSRKMREKIGKTLEILFSYYADEQEPRFKEQAKQLTRRVIICGVGYLKLDFQREMGRTPDIEAKIADHAQRLQHLERLAQEVDTGDIKPGDAQLEELRTGMETLMNEPEVILREGLNFEFPSATSIIIDPACTQLKGFIGAGWIAQQFSFSAGRIKEIYGVDIKDLNAKQYNKTGDMLAMSNSATSGDGRSPEPLYRVYEVYDKASGQLLVVCDGAKDFLQEPGPPRVFIERFWPIFSLSFNDVEWSDQESVGNIFPPSDVRLMRAMQTEHNRSREGLREHRIANRPAYIGPANVLKIDEKAKLGNHEASELIEIQNMSPGTDPRNIIVELPKAVLDPNIYDTAPFFEDASKVTGAQSANWGAVSGAAATEVSVAEGSRMADVQSNVDDMDDFLSNVAQAAGHVLLRELSAETALEIAGPGAVWPSLTGADIAKDIYLDVKAGSSGRPNKAMELANFERIAPTLLQLPGLPPRLLAQEALRRMDDQINLDDWFSEILPSVISMNRGAGAGMGAPTSSDPNAQGPQGAQGGANNEEQAPGRPPGAQPAYPAAGEGAGVGNG